MAERVVAAPSASELGSVKPIVWSSLPTELVRVADVAAYVASPAWDAVIEQIPSASAVRVEPETEQTALVPDAYVTGRPDDAIAVSVRVSPTMRVAGRLKLIVWVWVEPDEPTVRVAVTGVAGAYVALPSWEAVTEQVPAPVAVSVVPEIEQTGGGPTAYVTARPESAVAASVVVAPSERVAGSVKAIAWATLATEVVWVTEAAGAYVVLPAWAAVTEQVPAASAVSVVPVIEQTDGVPDVYETGRVELALAASVVVPPTTSAGSWPKVIDWASRVTDVVRVEAAPAYVASPAWVAVTEQVPSASAVRVVPEIEQIADVELE